MDESEEIDFENQGKPSSDDSDLQSQPALTSPPLWSWPKAPEMMHSAQFPSAKRTMSDNRCACGRQIHSNGENPHELISSHDTSSSVYHTALDTWLNDLTEALNAAWPKRHVTYSDVHALMITWEDNDIPHMDKEVTRLSNVLKGEFGYKIHPLIIPASKADLKIRREVDNFIENYGDQDNLLIVYYAGHARPGTHSGAPPIWHSKNSEKDGMGTSFDTANIQSILARAQEDSPDVLLIYDCCHSLYAHPTNNETSRAVVECLFAGGFEAKVPVAGPDSFTSALIDELCEAVNSPTALSVADLHRGVIDRLERWKARGIFGVNNKIIKDKKTGKIALTKAVRTTPIHMSLSVNEPRRTIFLTPQSPRNLHDEESSDDITESEEKELPRVLMAVRVIDDVGNTEALKRWILAAPLSVVHFEKVYRSHSELILVELPLPVWDLLPQNPAVAFIGFVKGEASLSSSMRDANNSLNASKTRNSFLSPKSDNYSNEGDSYELEPPKDFISRGISQATDSPDSNLQLFYPGIEADGRLISLLNAIDRILPVIFAHLEWDSSYEIHELESFFGLVLEQLNKIETVSAEDIAQYKHLLLRYISARHLMEFDQPWLQMSERLDGFGILDRYNNDDLADSDSELSKPSLALWDPRMIDSRTAPSIPDTATEISTKISPRRKNVMHTGDEKTVAIGDYESELPLELYKGKASAVEVQADTRPSHYTVHPSTDFEPGLVFQILWSDTKGHTISGKHYSNTSSNDSDKILIGFRRFIVVNNDARHSTCVPIHTYDGKGCLKKGTNPKAHGIIYTSDKQPRLLKGEPELGHPPILMTMTAENEVLARESRVNYGNTVIIDHNIKVFFIGTIAPEQFDIVKAAIEERGNRKLKRKGRLSPPEHTRGV
ncbi:hypothetical protein M426DRAFT_326250 [Hypoxylon sp. CI-4A]|nr:hypothetical protein M426DRAFT_326250 [Hypoxylon sp. CI-4A]